MKGEIYVGTEQAGSNGCRKLEVVKVSQYVTGVLNNYASFDVS
jgi:hypothetical protein